MKNQKENISTYKDMVKEMNALNKIISFNLSDFDRALKNLNKSFKKLCNVYKCIDKEENK